MGARGSTCTAKVKVEITREAKTTDFLGQAIWRYQPETHQFEVFAEGGGNTFGLEFDDAGRAFSGTNWGKYRGLHFVQGGYYLKGWGKHGPLTNPYAFGFFDHMPHTGNADRLSHTFVVYGGGLFGSEYDGKIISPNSLQSRVQVTRLEPAGSSYQTAEEPFMMTCDDGWFRPVDLKVGPDGAIYVADFYERRISHVDPRDTWDRSTGRIWRIRPAGWKPGLKPFDLGKETGDDLVHRLASKNRWERTLARETLALRRDESVIPMLRKQIVGDSPAALESLWALYSLGGMDDATALLALQHHDPAVRTWAVRLLGDVKDKPVASVLFDRMLDMAGREPDSQTRSQLASTAKRLPAEQAIGIVRRMLAGPDDSGDVHIPLLLWWAVEDKAVTARDQVVSAFSAPNVWHGKLAREEILPRLARRYAADPSWENQQALAALLAGAPGAAERALLLGGVKEGFAGLPLRDLAPALKAALADSNDPEIGVRLGDAAALQKALRVVQDEKAPDELRIRFVGLLGQAGDTDAVPALLKLVGTSHSTPVRKAALESLGRFDDPDLGRELVALCIKLPADLHPAAVSTLLGRPAWTADLLGAIDSGALPRTDLGPTQIQRIRQYDDPAVIALADKLFGRVTRTTSREMEQEVERVTKLVTTGAGDAAAGRELFTQRCAVCHTLFGNGGKLGPDLTGYERRNVDFLVVSVVDPSAYIREEYTAFRIRTRDGETLMGIITERAANQITIVDSSQQKTVIPKAQILEEARCRHRSCPKGSCRG